MDTIVIIGGHLASSDGIMIYGEDAFETPLGLVEADGELRESLGMAMHATEDHETDNTVEIQLPFVRFAAPQARVVGMRAPPSTLAERLGECIAETASMLGRKVAVLGSTDLTHYGPGYGFTPAGSEAVPWVRDVNDRRLIDAALSMDIPSVLDRSCRERSACSAGGAVGAISFARARGVREGVLLQYRTSYEIHQSDSFVGYAGILFS
jgi:AmmeMemoRadiSam system protein B